MRTRTSILLAVSVGLLGMALRIAIPVTPVDDAFRDVIRFYQAIEPMAR